MGRPQERGPRRRPRGALFCILEDGFFLLDRHLQRMRDSAEYFGFAFPAGDIHKALGRRRREVRYSVASSLSALAGRWCARRALASPAIVSAAAHRPGGRADRSGRRVLVSQDHESDRVRSGRIGWPRRDRALEHPWRDHRGCRANIVVERDGVAKVTPTVVRTPGRARSGPRCWPGAPSAKRL